MNVNNIPEDVLISWFLLQGFKIDKKDKEYIIRAINNNPEYFKNK